MIKILIAEDDFAINEILTHIVNKLKSDYPDLECQSCFAGSEAQKLLQNQTFDVVLLDLMLPFISGYELLPQFLARGTSVLIITAKNDIATLVNVLNNGAADYIAKPFRREEVLARLRKLLLQKFPDVSSILRYKNITLNNYHQTVTVDDNQVKLTKIEFKLLAFFLNEPQRVFTKKQIYENVWGQEFMQDQTLNVHLSNVRNKLKIAGFPASFKVIWGVGWRFE